MSLCSYAVFTFSVQSLRPNMSYLCVRSILYLKRDLIAIVSILKYHI
jgi:hypothetical protein